MMGHITKEMIVSPCLEIEKIFPTTIPRVTVLKYVLALLVLKRSSDLFDEADIIRDEQDNCTSETRMSEIAEKGERNPVFRFELVVPPSAFWKTICKPEPKIGDRLNQGFANLIGENRERMLIEQIPFAHLDGKMLDFNSTLLGNSSQREEILHSSVAQISRINLGNVNLDTRQVLDDAIDEIVDHFISQNPELFVTPESVSRLLVGLSEIDSTAMVISEAGDGTIIRRILRDVVIPGWPERKLGFKAFVSDKCLFFVTSLRMFLHGYTGIEVIHRNMAQEAADEKRAKFFLQLREHNHVIGSIPAEQHKRIETEQEYLDDTTHSFGISLNKKSEYAHLVGMLRNLVSGGKLVVAVPPQMLYKQRSEGQFRKKMVESDMIEAVIQLPPKLYPSNPAAYSIWIIRKFKTSERIGKVLLFDAEILSVDEGKKNTLPDETIDQIISVYKEFSEIPGKSRIVTLGDIAECDYTLEVSRYFNLVKSPKMEINISEKIALLKSVSKEKNELIDHIIDSIANLEKMQTVSHNGG